MMRGFGFMGIWGWAGMILNVVVFLALVGALIWLIVSVSRRGGSQAGQAVPPPPAVQPPAGPTPREIAQARYARGEINREEYQQILKDLES